MPKSKPKPKQKGGPPAGGGGACTMMLVTAVSFPSDQAKRKALSLELSMAFASAYLTHSGKGRNRMCFGVITDSNTTVTLSQEALGLVPSHDGSAEEEILARTEYYRYNEIWRYRNKKGNETVGFNTLGRFVGYQRVLQEEAAKVSPSALPPRDLPEDNPR